MTRGRVLPELSAADAQLSCGVEPGIQPEAASHALTEGLRQGARGESDDAERVSGGQVRSVWSAYVPCRAPSSAFASPVMTEKNSADCPMKRPSLVKALRLELRRARPARAKGDRGR